MKKEENLFRERPTYREREKQSKKLDRAIESNRERERACNICEKM